MLMIFNKSKIFISYYEENHVLIWDMDVLAVVMAYKLLKLQYHILKTLWITFLNSKWFKNLWL